MRIHVYDAGRNLLEEKVSQFSEISQNSNSEELFQVKPVISWNGQNSFRRIIQILGILLHFNLGGFSLYVSFSKRAVQIFGGFRNPLHSPKEWTQQNTYHEIWDFRDLRFLKKSSENKDFFPWANLILRPAWVHRTDIR